MLQLFVGITLLVLASGLTVDELEVHTPYGILIGVERNHYTAFEGIPYAEPPIGELRFEPPVPFHTKWTGTRPAIQSSNKCMQWSHFIMDKDDRLEGSEDCLYLNIYTPKNISRDEKIPVIFYIHGGALMFGQGDFYGPEYLTSRPLILVTFNYRLGPLGFLSSGCSLMPGNMGMKDQNIALRWVKKHIELFGGDSERITITGFSAGGASVHSHMLSDLSSGLFNNGISHSGTALDPWVMQVNAQDKFNKVAELIGCDSQQQHSDIVTCLKRKPAEDIVRTVKEFQPFLYNPFQVFGIVVETAENNSMPFLTDHPKNLIKNGHMQGSSWIVSETKDEGLYPAGEFLRMPQYLPYINAHWNEIAPLILHYQESVPEEQLAEISQKIKQHYLGDQPINENNFQRFVDIPTDRLFHLSCDEVARTQGKQLPLYVYYYNYKLSYGVGEIFAGKTSNLLGVSHGDDVLLLYSIDSTYVKGNLSEGEKMMQQKLLDLYVSYAYTGEPKFGDVPLVTTDSEDLVRFTKINGPNPKDIQIESFDNIGDREFWKTIKFNE